MRKTRRRPATLAGAQSIADAGGRPASAAPSLYDEVTAKIIAELEAGRFPWVQPWRAAAGFGAGAGVSLPRNALTGRSYSGVNILLLWGAVIDAGFPS
ncbi:MAG: antirestriction protein ArdC, partial [Sphingopyxis macrogoltabida]